MWRGGRWGTLVGVVCALGLVAIVAWAQTVAGSVLKVEMMGLTQRSSFR